LKKAADNIWMLIKSNWPTFSLKNQIRRGGKKQNCGARLTADGFFMAHDGCQGWVFKLV